MNAVFREHVTGIAFNLTLSKNMCAMLIEIADGNPPYHYGNFVTTWRRLEDRGLVVPRHGEKGKPFVLSEEGKLVAELVRRAGIVSHFSKAAEAA